MDATVTNGPDFTTLAATQLAGDDRLTLCSGRSDIHHITIAPGSEREQTARVWRTDGTGPYVLRLGHDKDHPTPLNSPHPIGTAVRIEGISAELAAARVKAAFGPCAHPEVVPVETLDGDLVAWLCPGCDERLPKEWQVP